MKPAFLSSLQPTAAELETLRFGLPMPSMSTRLLLAAGFFLGGLGVWLLMPFPWNLAGLVLVVCGHVFLWVRPITNAPGGATPEHEEMWAPVEDDWFERLDELEHRAAKWDATPWDLSNWRGCLVMAVALSVVAGALIPVSGWLGFDTAWRLAVAAAALLVPLWLSGLRTVWQPSELRLKGEALEIACETVEAEDPGRDFDRVPMLALREGRRGKYPVDARLMLRPRAAAASAEGGATTSSPASGFLGVQIQVAINNVQGKDYPYLYGVVLGKEDVGFRLPNAVRANHDPRYSVQFVIERGADEGVRFLVLRQHADNSGGWHTEPEHIREIVSVVLAVGRQAWQENETT